MIFDNAALSLMFRMINLAILGYIFWYLFKKYVLPALQEGAVHELREEQEATNAVRYAEDKAHLLRNDIAAECALFDRLHNTVEKWHEKQAELYMRTIEHRHAQMRAFHERMKEQREQYAHNAALHKIIDGAVEHACEVVHARMRIPSDAHRYMARALERTLQDLSCK